MKILRLCFVVGAIVVVGVIEYGDMLRWNKRWAMVVQMLGYLYRSKAIRFLIELSSVLYMVSI